MNPNSSPSPSSNLSPNNNKPGLDSIRAIVVLINHCILEFLTNSKTRSLLKLKCASKLSNQKQEFFEFSDQSVLSNLYWGIENMEAAIHAKTEEERASRLKNSEQMLQVPALLDEHELTVGVPNSYLVCCSYFYLSMVKKLQMNELQVALHFLQALMVSPKLIQEEFAPELCCSFLSSNREELRERFSDEEYVKAMRKMARTYKKWLMYYQVILYGESPIWHKKMRGSFSDEQEQQCLMNRVFHSAETSDSSGDGQPSKSVYQSEKVHSLDPIKSMDDVIDEQSRSTGFPGFDDYRYSPKSLYQDSKGPKIISSMKSLQGLVKEVKSSSESESHEVEYVKENLDYAKHFMKNAYNSHPEIGHQNLQFPICTSGQKRKATPFPRCLRKSIQEQDIKVQVTELFTSAITDYSIFSWDNIDENTGILSNYHVEDGLTWRETKVDKFQLFGHAQAMSLKNSSAKQMNHQKIDLRRVKSTHCQRNISEVYSLSGKKSKTELSGLVRRAISKLIFSEEMEKWDEDYAVEVSTVYTMLNTKTGVRYNKLKEVIISKLVRGISTSKEEKVLRAAVSILVSIISANGSVVEDIKKNGLRLCDLASALKKNVYEAAILIYLINPTPSEIKSLELLPTLVEVVVGSNDHQERPAATLQITPPTASLMIIEVLVTAFDDATNKKHLAALSSPTVLCGLLEFATIDNVEEMISLATILVKCIQFDGKCRKFMSEFTPIAPFIYLLQCNSDRAMFIALEFLHEVLCIPRSSAVLLLHRIEREGRNELRNILMFCVKHLQPEYQILAASLLIQLCTMSSNSNASEYKEEAIQTLIRSVGSEECSDSQLLSALILSNLGGTFAWTGESYTVPWLVRKSGLTSITHQNMIKTVNWSDQILQDAGTDLWSGVIAGSFIEVGIPVFHALANGLKSKIKKVSRDCLVAVAWLGCEIARSPESTRCSACEILLGGFEQFLHPGLELDERLLACLCIYNYTSGKGMQNLIHFSEGVRESLRRLSSVTWMAEELHKVTDYFLPNSSRISCVHTQVLEMGISSCGAVCSLIYYKGLLYSGYSDGSIKVWNISRQSSTLIWDVKEHKKVVTCFTLSGTGDNLLSGSADKTIRVWRIGERQLECIEVITFKEPIQHIESCGHMIFTVTHGRGVKVFDTTREVKVICKNKQVKCIKATQGKIYAGCMDSSIQEFSITNNREQEIKAPSKSWRILRDPINTIIVYKDWLFSANSTVQGSQLQEWRRHCKPQVSIATGKGETLQAMGVVEDFIYLISRSSTNIQIWLRRTQHKVGRISAGSRITSLLTGNDIILCGTDTGIIKGWIPL